MSEVELINCECGGTAEFVEPYNVNGLFVQCRHCKKATGLVFKTGVGDVETRVRAQLGKLWTNLNNPASKYVELLRGSREFRELIKELVREFSADTFSGNQNDRYR